MDLPADPKRRKGWITWEIREQLNKDQPDWDRIIALATAARQPTPDNGRTQATR